MGGAEAIVAEVRAELAGELRERVRARLREQPVEWLVEELVRLLVPEDAAVPAQGGAPPVEDEAERAARAERVRALGLDAASLPGYAERYRALDRPALEAAGMLVGPPPKGGPLIGASCRSAEGEALLREAKDVLHALLFCGEDEGVRIERVQRELLTLTVPRAKLHAIGFVMRAATEIGAQGTWRDPHGTAHDERAANTLLQVEYGEGADERVGTAIAACLRLINELEINEQVLYGRMENVEESTL
ncbi:MAG TPA: hypothetical protein VHJ17_11660 [Thermomonospora sp.]|nr:hypothetical protein [Thermomonospora sp.]